MTSLLNFSMAYLLLREHLARQAGARPRVYRTRVNIDDYDDVDLLQRYRFDREGIMKIHDMVEDRIAPLSINSNNTSSLVKVLCALRFYATGSMQRVIGDTVGLSNNSVGR